MKNNVLYDDTYLGPGFLIITKENDEVVKFLKIFIMNNYGFPNYGLRAFSIFGKDNLDKKYTIIDFDFTDTMDTKNNLYKIFNDLYIALKDNKVETIDKFYQGTNSFSLKKVNNIVTLSVFKDVYGVKNATDFIDINIGDETTCNNYQAIDSFYKQLLNSDIKKSNQKDIKQLILSRLK